MVRLVKSGQEVPIYVWLLLYGPLHGPLARREHPLW